MLLSGAPASPPGGGRAAAAPWGPPTEPGRFSHGAELAWLLGILGVSLVLRLALAPGRWINPDEGAHLMDGRLALDGLLPFINFDSRQIGYTYALAALLSLSGHGYLGVRLCLAALTVANIYLVYLIAGRLFDGRAAVVATLLYAAQPLAVIWAPIVHTEPVTIFPTCLGVYALLRHLRSPGDRRWLVLTGVTLAFAFYVRESSLGVTAAVLFVLAAESWGSPRQLVGRYGLFGLGFLIPCAGFTALYLGHISPRAWWTSPLNPLTILIEHVPRLGQEGNVAASGSPGNAALLTEQSHGKTTEYLQSVAIFSAGLLAALVASVGLASPRLGGLRPDRRGPHPRMLLYAWLAGLTAVYGYWAMHRGFFPQYTEEFLPPLCVLAGAVVVELLDVSVPRARTGPVLGLLALYLGTAFALGRLRGTDVPSYVWFLVPALGLALAQLAPEGGIRRWTLLASATLLLLLLASAGLGAPMIVRKALKLALIPTVLAGVYLASSPGGPRRSRFQAFCVTAAIAAALGYSSGRAGAAMDLGYETVWPPETVRTVAALIGRSSGEDDRVMSGAVIWELEAGKRPFANISHPLGFRRGGPQALAERLELELHNVPPRFVVLDGYTERTYGLLLPDLLQTLAVRYRLVLDVPGARYPVRVYQLQGPSGAS